MTHTHFRDDQGEVIKNVAYSFINGVGALEFLCLANYDIFGATNLFTPPSRIWRDGTLNSIRRESAALR